MSEWYQENCPLENHPPPRKKKIVPLWKYPLWIFPLWKLPLRIFPPRKLAPGEITSSETPSPFINHANERKNKIIEFFTLKKAVQYNILIKITKVLFDTQMISQKILGLDTFFTEWKNSQVAFTCQLYKSRRTKTRQSNYKIWQIGETTK